MAESYTADGTNIAWFGTTDNMVTRYPASTSGSTLATTTYIYVWHANQIAGRFANDSAWWRYDDSGANPKLTLGVDVSATNKKVTETAAQQPWLKDANNTTIVSKTNVKIIETQNGIAPTNLAGWFQGYTALTSFDGSHMDVSNVTTFANLFANLTNLTDINLDTWEMPATQGQTAVPRDGMFTSVSALKNLTLSDGVILVASTTR